MMQADNTKVAADSNHQHPNPDFGKPQPLTDEDKALIDAFQAEASQEKLTGFDCVVRSYGRCGFANGGSDCYVVNTNPRVAHTVTVDETWRRGIDDGFSQRVIMIAAGGRVGLGCSSTNNIPVTYYTWTVVGET